MNQLLGFKKAVPEGMLSRMLTILGFTVTLALGLGGVGCSDQELTGDGKLTAELDAAPASPSSPESSPEPVQARFVDRAAELGLDFVHINGMSGGFYLSEILGSGAALFDYDNDGDLDVYLVQGHPLQAAGQDDEPSASTKSRDSSYSDRLFRNELSETGVLSFSDVTSEAGELGHGYGMGVTTGDIDNDGFVDLYVTGFEHNQMLHNEGDGSFRDITEMTATDDARWSVSASFLDFDLDGRLDLFVSNYVAFTLTNSKECFSLTSARDYCFPLNYEPYPDRLFRNLGPDHDGATFEDVSARSGIYKEYGAALGVISADFNGDGLPDVYVANDALANQMWIGQLDGRFENQALLSGTAFNLDGKAEASMGLVAGDFDDDGDEDLFMTHLMDETNTLYRNDGSGDFTDHSLSTGVGLPSRNFTGFGAGWIDQDNDGHLDLLVVNGAVRNIPALERAGDPFPLHETNQLLLNTGDGQFEDISDRAGDAFKLSEVSRGAAFGDIDNDGDTDVVVVNNNGPVRLLINEIGQDNGWLGLKVLERSGGRDAYGARVALTLADGRTLWRRVGTDGSYASAGDPRILVGLGESAVQVIEVIWPGGDRELWDYSDRPIRTYDTLIRGSGRQVASP